MAPKTATTRKPINAAKRSTPPSHRLSPSPRSTPPSSSRQGKASSPSSAKALSPSSAKASSPSSAKASTAPPAKPKPADDKATKKPAGGDKNAKKTAATSARPKGGDAKSEAEKRAEEKKPWTVKALGLFDRIDADDSGLIDQEELMAKLRADGQLEELLGTKSLAIDVDKDVKESKAAQRDRLISMLFDEFDVTDNTKGNQATRKQDRMLNRDEFSDLIRLGRIRVLFHRMDIDRSGSIEKNEFAAKLQADDELEELLGLPNVSGTKVYTNMIYTTLFNQYDDNKDGKLSREEFQRLCTEATIQAKEEAARQASVAEAAARPKSQTTNVEAESQGDSLPVEVS